MILRAQQIFQPFSYLLLEHLPLPFFLSFCNESGSIFQMVSPKVKVQAALLFSSFEHNSSMNELKNMKLNEHIYYEMIN